MTKTEKSEKVSEDAFLWERGFSAMSEFSLYRSPLNKLLISNVIDLSVSYGFRHTHYLGFEFLVLLFHARQLFS